ncbi:hypothetical protein EDC17_100211 [Sphingobacterium alimentarium]|uniref:Uncharacterized protein n=1 Tax=Sphingobacterium alimentarium TaxID=797292 RepID=A0A4R3W1L1_9SPHI|nr:hypothetical protein [Sphingobacterium alimentarium]TCV20305.1 hypothetical protein EDC17_100211 [Sphingobacterium alimentarium]
MGEKTPELLNDLEMINRISKIIVLAMIVIMIGTFCANAQVNKWKLNEKKPASISDQNRLPYKHSDYAIVSRNVKESFEKWLQKGEFEKSTEYERRVKENSNSKFSEICVSEMEKIISQVSMRIIQYDADNELFIFKFRNSDHIGVNEDRYARRSLDLSKFAFLSVPFSQAERFKKDFENSNYYVNKVIFGLKWSKIGNQLVPTKGIIAVSEKNTKPKIFSAGYHFVIPDDNNQEDIIFSTSKLKIQIIGISPIVFNYSQYYNSIVEHEKELELVNEVKEIEKKASEDAEKLSLLIEKEAEEKKKQEEEQKRQIIAEEQKNRAFIDFSPNKILIGKLKAYYADKEIAVINLYDESSSSLLKGCISVKLPKTIAPAIIENVEREKGNYPGKIVVVPTQHGKVDSSSSLEATVLFFLYDRNQGMYGGTILDRNTEISMHGLSISRTKRTTRVSSKALIFPYDRQGISLTNINDPKAIDKKNLFYDWKIAETPNLLY